jgi:hypothetical protein
MQIADRKLDFPVRRRIGKQSYQGGVMEIGVMVIGFSALAWNLWMMRDAFINRRYGWAVGFGAISGWVAAALSLRIFIGGQ